VGFVSVAGSQRRERFDAAPGGGSMSVGVTVVEQRFRQRWGRLRAGVELPLGRAARSATR
jgi:hypothetical protein